LPESDPADHRVNPWAKQALLPGFFSTLPLQTSQGHLYISPGVLRPAGALFYHPTLKELFMVTKLAKPSAPVKSSTKTSAKSASKASVKPATGSAKSVLSSSVKDSAQQIWQAGLGAFTKAQVEGTKAYEALVKEGVSFQRKTQSAAEEKINEATQKMTSMATDISSKASGQWDKLESIFEDRVAKALNKLGVPSAKDIAVLIARIDALNASVQKLSPAKAAAKPAAKAAAKKRIPAAKPAPTAAAKKGGASKAAAKAPAATAQVNPQ
jgi:poly(hydroxyalkanoate) granule-associated protein